MHTVLINSQEKGTVSNRLLEDKTKNQSDAEFNLAVLTLDCNGTIRECSKAGAEFLGCSQDKLIYRHVSIIFPKLEDIKLMKGNDINPNLRFLSRVGYHFDGINMSGVHMACALFFNEVENFGNKCLRVIFRPVEDGYAAV